MTWNVTKNRPIHLIVEDDVIRNQLIKLLDELTVAVKSFDNVDAFLSEPLHEAPACLITEIKLSNSDGITLIKQMRKHGLSTPVVVLSDGNDGIEKAVQAIQAGAADFIEKPILERDFIERVQVILQDNDN